MHDMDETFSHEIEILDKNQIKISYAKVKKIQ